MRFPEFTEEWKIHSLTDYLEFKNGMNPDAKRFGKGTKFISVMDILNNRYICYDNIRAFVEANESDFDNFGVHYGDILFQRSSETLEDVGRANVYLDNNPAIFGGFIIRGRKKGNYNPLFFRYLLASPYARKRIIKKGAGAQHFNIGQAGLSKILLNFPSIKEQERIAKLFNIIDERIATQNKIIDRLESLIKGLCLNLQLIGLKNNTWQKVYLTEVLTERKEKNKDNYEVHSVSVSHGIVNQIGYLGRSFAAKDTSNYHVVKNGDIVYTKSPTGEFPYGIVKQSMIIEDVAVSPLYGVYMPENKDIGTILHYYFMNCNNTNNYLHPLIQKGAKNTINITNQHFLDNAVILPNNTEEIKNVASLLSSIQYKIATNNKLLNSYKKQKQYLLQYMFI